jgi:ABC-type bacteriocin/lantibiotic exporter with double-glycine peptidase domain
MITNFGMIAILWYGGNLVIDGELTVGQLTAFLFYSNSYSSSVGNISDSLTSITVASGVAETLFEMFDYKNKVKNMEDGEEGKNTIFAG